MHVARAQVDRQTASRRERTLGSGVDKEAARDHATRAGLRHAGRVGAARALLDGLAVPGRAVGRTHGRRAPGGGRGREGDRALRAGHHDRAAGSRPPRPRCSAARGSRCCRWTTTTPGSATPGPLSWSIGPALWRGSTGASTAMAAGAGVRPGRPAGRGDLHAARRAALCCPDRARGRRSARRRRGQLPGLRPLGARSEAQSGPVARGSRRCWPTTSASPR